jgi:hypothetical protein
MIPRMPTTNGALRPGFFHLPVAADKIGSTDYNGHGLSRHPAVELSNMLFSLFSRFSAVSPAFGPGRAAIFLTTCGTILILFANADGQTVSKSEKHIIGATATITEASSGMPFAARIDTGAASCSLHVEKIEIADEATKPLDNIGKAVRFQLKNDQGKTAWVDAKIAGVVRVRSSALKDGEYDRRYKVALTLKWKDFEKEVLVTLNDRTAMKFPLLIGRNYLHRDFLVDVDIDDLDQPLAEHPDDQ